MITLAYKTPYSKMPSLKVVVFFSVIRVARIVSLTIRHLFFSFLFFSFWARP